MITADGTSYVQGKLSSSQRHNYQPVLGDILLTESFEYNNAGRISKKTTRASDKTTISDTTIQTFEQKLHIRPPRQHSQGGIPDLPDRVVRRITAGGIRLHLRQGLSELGSWFHRLDFVFPDRLDEAAQSFERGHDRAGAGRQWHGARQEHHGFELRQLCRSGSGDQRSTGRHALEQRMTATLTVYATGSSLTYQWYNATTGQAIGGATSSTYTTLPLTQTRPTTSSSARPVARYRAGRRS